MFSRRCLPAGRGENGERPHQPEGGRAGRLRGAVQDQEAHAAQQADEGVLREAGTGTAPPGNGPRALKDSVPGGSGPLVAGGWGWAWGCAVGEQCPFLARRSHGSKNPPRYPKVPREVVSHTSSVPIPAQMLARSQFVAVQPSLLSHLRFWPCRACFPFGSVHENRLSRATASFTIFFSSSSSHMSFSLPAGTFCRWLQAAVCRRLAVPWCCL